MMDRATNCWYALPVDTKDTLEIYKCLNSMKGSDHIDIVYSDNWPAIEAACRELGVNWEASQPGVHHTNAVIENVNKTNLEATRTMLVEAGLPGCFLTFAMPCHCFLHNITPNDEGLTPWYKRFGTEFEGQAIPLGCGVYFKPAPTKVGMNEN